MSNNRIAEIRQGLEEGAYDEPAYFAIRDLLTALDTAEAKRAAPSRDDLRALEIQVDPIRKRLERGQYRTLPVETIEGDIAYLLRALAAAQGTPCPDPTRHQRSTVCASEGTPAPRPADDEPGLRAAWEDGYTCGRAAHHATERHNEWPRFLANWRNQQSAATPGGSR